MSKLAVDRNAFAIQVLRPLSTQKVNFTATAAASSAISANARVVRLVSTGDCSYAINATATTSDTYLPAGVIEFIHVYEGDTISFIANTTSGSAYVTEMV